VQAIGNGLCIKHKRGTTATLETTDKHTAYEKERKTRGEERQADNIEKGFWALDSKREKERRRGKKNVLWSMADLEAEERGEALKGRESGLALRKLAPMVKGGISALRKGQLHYLASQGRRKFKQGASEKNWSYRGEEEIREKYQDCFHVLGILKLEATHETLKK